MDPELLMKRVARERAARQEAETLLEEKSRELYEARRAAEQRAADLAEANTRLHQEIDERERTQQALAAARDEALEATRLKMRFLANISHEIRTPMNAVLGILDEGASWPIEEEWSSLLKVARRSASELLTLLNDLLDLSKLEAKQMDMYLQPTDIPNLLEDVRDLFASNALAKGLDLTCNCQKIDSAVMVDPNRLRQILTNLVSNAVRLTDSGRVSVGCQLLCGSRLRFSVRDDGPGISPEDQVLIFRSFVQVKSSRTSGGTGLGLAISEALVRVMDGTIGVESALGRGSTFWFEIAAPAAQAPVAAVPVEKALIESGLRVLVVDDNPVNRMVLMRQLKALGCTPTEAESGEECIEIGRKQRFDVVLMDVYMPGMNGLEACRQLLLNQPGLPVLACSASVLEEDRLAAQEVGMVGFVPKPIRRDDLQEALARI